MKTKLTFFFLAFISGIASAQFKDILNFNYANGANPLGSLTLSGNVLYGMAGNGGANRDGCIFSIDTNGSGYKDLFDFNGTSGSQPLGDITLFGNEMYGMTFYGGANDSGCIFSINTNGSNYKDLLDFNYSNGAYPGGDLTLSGNVLYGTTSDGGVNGLGCIFSIDTNGSRYKKLLDFNGTNGAGGNTLTLSGNVLYGTNGFGGAHNEGNIFSIDTNGSGFKDLFDFNNTSGANPVGSLNISGNNLFGMTEGGVWPVDTNGAVFSFKDISLGINEIAQTSGVFNLFPNPNNGNFTISLTGVSEKAQITVYNILGEQVYHSSLQATNTQIDLSNKAEGLYLYRVLTETGTLVSEGKFAVQK